LTFNCILGIFLDNLPGITNESSGPQNPPSHERISRINSPAVTGRQPPSWNSFWASSMSLANCFRRRSRIRPPFLLHRAFRTEGKLRRLLPIALFEGRRAVGRRAEESTARHGARAMGLEEAILGLGLLFNASASSDMARRDAPLHQLRAVHQETVALERILL